MRDNPLWWLGLDAEEEEPNVCKMLGIGTGVKFRIGNDRTIFWVNRDGSFGTEPACVPGSTYLFLRALNGQEKISLVERAEPVKTRKEDNAEAVSEENKNGMLQYTKIDGELYREVAAMKVVAFQAWLAVSEMVKQAMWTTGKKRFIIDFDPEKDHVSVLRQLEEQTDNTEIISQTEDAAPCGNTARQMRFKDGRLQEEWT